MRFCGLTIGPASVQQPREASGHAGGVVLCAVRRGPFRPFCPFCRSCPFSRFRSVRSAGPVLFFWTRSARPPGLFCPASPHCGPDAASDIHTLSSLHLTSFPLHRSRSVSCTPGVFSSGTRFFVVSACSLSLFWPALSLSVCGLHGAGVLPFPSCRPVPAARFRSGSTDGKEGRVVGKIGKLSVLSKLLSVFLLKADAHPSGGADVRRARDPLFRPDGRVLLEEL